MQGGEMEVILVIEVLLIIGKVLLGLLIAIAVLVIAFLGLMFYCICISEDNCTACPGALDGSCARCRIHKNKVKRAKKESKKQEKLMNKRGEK